MLPGEEEESSLRTEEHSHADEEEDVTHGKERAVEEEDEAEDEEEETYRYTHRGISEMGKREKDVRSFAGVCLPPLQNATPISRDRVLASWLRAKRAGDECAYSASRKASRSAWCWWMCF